MDIHFVASAAVLFFMLMDPFGNLPVFVAELEAVPPERFTHVIFRESCFALVAMMLALAAGGPFMRAAGLTPSTLRLAGGFVLFVIGARMFFSVLRPAARTVREKEPFIVPIAIPLICGPGTFVMAVTLRGSTPAATAVACTAAMLAAWAAQTAVLMNGRLVARALGDRALGALKSLTGLLLACLAVGMFLRGLNDLYGLHAAL